MVLREFERPTFESHPPRVFSYDSATSLNEHGIAFHTDNARYEYIAGQWKRYWFVPRFYGGRPRGMMMKTGDYTQKKCNYD